MIFLYMKALISKEGNLSSVRRKNERKLTEEFFFFPIDEHFMHKKSFHIKRKTEFGKQSRGAALHLSLSTPPYLGVLPLTKGTNPDLQLSKKRVRH